MKIKALGFELAFAFAFGPTLETRIQYLEWLRGMQRWRCRIWHDTAWCFDPRFPGYRWYCCRNCGETWLTPLKGIGTPP